MKEKPFGDIFRRGWVVGVGGWPVLGTVSLSKINL